MAEKTQCCDLLPPLFAEDAYKQFANFVCDDIGLLAVSRRVAKGGNSTDTVGTCLSIGDDDIKKVHDDPTRPKHQDKVYYLLKEWKHKNTHNATWANLVQCLSHLEDQQLMNGIKSILRNKEYPNTDYSLYGTTQSVQECANATIPIPARFVASSSPPSYISQLSNMSNPTSCSTPSDAGYYFPSSGGSSLVVGKPYALQDRIPHPFDDDEPIKPALRSRMKGMEDRFSLLMARAPGKLTGSLDTIRLYITGLSASVKENVPLFDDHMLEIISESTLNEIFSLLTRLGSWDFLNFYILERLAKAFGNEELVGEIEQYGEAVEAFKEETKLTDFLRIWSGRTLHGTLPNRKAVIVKLQAKWPEYTLADVACLEKYLSGEFLLEHFIFHFSNAERGCVTIMWLVPASVIPLMKAAAKELENKLRKTDIQELTIDGTSVFQVPRWAEGGYETLHKLSIESPEQFWGYLAKTILKWEVPFEKVMEGNMKDGNVRWFVNGKLNVSENCLDRHARKAPDRVAIIWEKDEHGQQVRMTYKELLDKTCQIAHVLVNKGVKKGDKVIIYMPAIPLAVASILACARIGAVHGVVFSAFDAKALNEKILDTNAKVVITADEGVVGGKTFHLKENVDDAVKGTQVKWVLVATRTGEEVPMDPNRDVYLEEEMKEQPTVFKPVPMDSEDTLFIMYTSGTSKKPKGIVHTQAGYLVYAAASHKYVFNHQPGDIIACMSDLGWICGLTYVVYGPLCNGGTTVLFESTATYPDCGRYWKMVERLNITHFLTVPSVIKHLKKAGDDYVTRYDRSSLKTLATTGEPLNQATRKWYYEIVGNKKCRVVDTWWQTETGGIAIPFQYEPEGSCPEESVAHMKPFFGVEPVLLTDKGEQIKESGVSGHLCLKSPLPGMGRNVNGDQNRFKKDYFTPFPGHYYTWDKAHWNEHGDLQITGRTDDAVRIKGVWLDIPAIESAVEDIDDVLEASVIQDPQNDDFCYIVVELKKEIPSRAEKTESLSRKVLKEIEASTKAKPNAITVLITRWTVKTHSGKNVRRLFRKAAPSHVQPCAYISETGPLLFELEFEVSDMRQCMQKLGLPENAYLIQTA